MGRPTYGSCPHSCGAGPSPAMQRCLRGLIILISLVSFCLGFFGEVCMRENELGNRTGSKMRLLQSTTEYVQPVWAGHC